MKVLLIGPLPLPVDGCSHANQTLLKNLALRGIMYVSINTSTNIISGKQGNKFSVRKAFPFIKTYLEIYKIFNCSVVYVTPGQTFFGVCKYAPFLGLCKILRKPYIIHLHGSYMGNAYEELKGIKKKAFRVLISGASAGIVLSESLCVNFEKLLPPHKIHIVANFIDTSLTSSALKKDEKQLRILYLSNLMREKGILDLLDGLIILKQNNIDFHVTVAGAMEKGIEGEFTYRCQALGNQIDYIGVVWGDKKKKVLREANVFVLPTYYKMEGQPICLLEGMATGNIIVTTAHAGIPDIVSKRNGFFVKKRSAEEIARCLQNIHSHLSSMVKHFSAYNIKYATGLFTEKIFTEKILKILDANAKA